MTSQLRVCLTTCTQRHAHNGSTTVQAKDIQNCQGVCVLFLVALVGWSWDVTPLPVVSVDLQQYRTSGELGCTSD
jgi:hypothetical protein